MARLESMAQIDAALNGGLSGQKFDPPSVAAPHAAPYVDAPTPLTGKEKEEQGEKLVVATPTPTPTPTPTLTPTTGAKKPTLSGTLASAQGILRGGGVALEAIPTPGSIAFPLIVLFVFFLLLLPVGGHTRFTWLWLVMTGNAKIGPDTGGGTSAATGGPVIDLSASLGALNQSTQQIATSAGAIGQGLTMTTFMTGVEQPS